VAGKHKNPSTLNTLMRGYMVQSYNMNAVGEQPADMVIEPDVTGDDLSEFTRTPELAEIGEETALETIPKLKQSLAQLDKQLFSAM